MTRCSAGSLAGGDAPRSCHCSSTGLLGAEAAHCPLQASTKQVCNGGCCNFRVREPEISSTGTESKIFLGLNISVGRKGAWDANPLCVTSLLQQTRLRGSAQAGLLPGTAFVGKCCTGIIVAWMDAYGRSPCFFFHCSCLAAQGSEY